MKPIKFLLTLAVIATVSYGCSRATAQTVNTINPQTMPSFSGGLQQMYDAVTGATNYGIAFGGGRSTTGQRNLAFVEVPYNFTRNLGLLIGYDYLWASKHLGQPSQANLVKGGINLQADLQPLKNLGFTNFTVTPFGFVLMATGNGTVSEIVGGGAKTTITTWKGINLNLGVIYEDRTGAGFWDGRYIGGFFALSKGF